MTGLVFFCSHERLILPRFGSSIETRRHPRAPSPRGDEQGLCPSPTGGKAHLIVFAANMTKPKSIASGSMTLRMSWLSMTSFPMASARVAPRRKQMALMKLWRQRRTRSRVEWEQWLGIVQSSFETIAGQARGSGPGPGALRKSGMSNAWQRNGFRGATSSSTPILQRAI